MQLPEDVYILVSLLNTKLRDEYSSLLQLCEEEDVDEVELSNRLAAAGYFYDAEDNAFKRS